MTNIQRYGLDGFDNIIEMRRGEFVYWEDHEKIVKQLILERDEARRTVCYNVTELSNRHTQEHNQSSKYSNNISYVTPEGYAKNKGWDCYKEETK